ALVVATAPAAASATAANIEALTRALVGPLPRNAAIVGLILIVLLPRLITVHQVIGALGWCAAGTPVRGSGPHRARVEAGTSGGGPGAGPRLVRLGRPVGQPRRPSVRAGRRCCRPGAGGHRRARRPAPHPVAPPRGRSYRLGAPRRWRHRSTAHRGAGRRRGRA